MHGNLDTRSEIKDSMSFLEWDVCVTTYETMLAEKKFFKKIAWQYLIIDEAHRLKNEKAAFSKTIRTLNCTSRLLITGTPIQNNLHELWSLLNCLLPEIFESSFEFDTWSESCLRDATRDTDADYVPLIERLKMIMEPLMLRRYKAVVESSLLPKIESTIFVRLTAIQHELYSKILSKKDKNDKNKFHQLRKFFNHPYLIDGIEPDDVTGG